MTFPSSCASAHPLYRSPRMALFTLAALGLAAAPVQAQATLTLNGNDSLSVSGAGTVGTQNGLPVANATSSYSRLNNVYAVQTNDASVFTLASGGSLTSGKLGSGLNANGSGLVTVRGGSISAGLNGFGLYATGSRPVTMFGGSISTVGGYGLLAGGGGPVTFSGGSISAGTSGIGLFSNSSGPVTITGGTLSAGQYGYALAADGGGPITISGGTLSAGYAGAGVFANKSGPVTITGGKISVGLDGYGLDDVGGTINLYRFADTPFIIDGVVMNNTTLDGSLYHTSLDTISGILANGDILDTTFYDLNGTINLNPPAAVPEASTTISLGLLLMLGMGGVLAARKKAGRA